jgi:hypothetical protein
VYEVQVCVGLTSGTVSIAGGLGKSLAVFARFSYSIPAYLSASSYSAYKGGEWNMNVEVLQYCTCIRCSWLLSYHVAGYYHSMCMSLGPFNDRLKQLWFFI